MTALKNQKIMAIASGGGHWIQMMRLKPALQDLDVFYVSLDPTSAVDVPEARYYCIRDASRKNMLGFLCCSLSTFGDSHKRAP